MTTTTVTYRLLKIQDPRTPGFFWYEIEGRDPATSATWCAAICDTRDEARETIAALRDAVDARETYKREGGAA